MNPCELRPANGTQCARDFGLAFAKQHGRAPTWNEVMNHVGTTWSKGHPRNMVNAAQSVAQYWLDNQPANLHKRIRHLETQLESTRAENRVLAQHVTALDEAFNTMVTAMAKAKADIKKISNGDS